MKKHIFIVFILLSSIIMLHAQPQKMTYQAVVRDANNELLVNQTIGVKISILQDSVNGLEAFVERHIGTTNANALLSLQIGTGTQVSLLPFSSIDWGHHYYYIKVEIDPTGGTLYTIAGTQELLSVPYAFYSGTAHYVDTALYAYKSDSSLWANTANIANYADSARVANTANSANTANTASSALTANYADSTRISNLANSANTANISISATYADTAFFLMNAQNSDTAKFAYHSDTANYALNSGSANYANTANTSNYADSTRISYSSKYSDTTLYSYKTDTSVYANTAYTSNTANYADSARVANTANLANTANIASSALTANYADSTRISNSANSANIAHYADTTRISNVANTANTANTAISATYADTADYNKLLNKPAGINHGDILYWESSDSSWHIVPVGNIGETLTLDSNKTPHWTQNSTQSVALPTIITDTIINITTNSAMAKGSVTTDGGSPFVFSGICWDTAHNPTTADFHTLDGIGLCSISSNLLGLTMGQYYYVRAFATNSAGTAYGNELVFRTQTYPAVTTNAISNISVTTALSGGDVTDDGGATVTARGVCWSSTSTAPTIADSHTSDGTGTGIYSSVLSSLARNTKYYVRAYATNYIGTSYGDTVSFTTLADFPTVTTAAVSSITSVTAVVGGEVTDDGDATVTTRGICYNTTGNPTIADNILPIGSGTGSFNSTLSGLTASTTYYIRAYATNISGTSYGSTISFTSADPWTCGISTITDYDNNVYNTVQIGTQCWIKENLRTTHYADGTKIALGSSTSTETAYIYYPQSDSSNITLYGYLYNWPAVMNDAVSSNTIPSDVQGICPNGWHVPSDTEVVVLINYLGTQSNHICGGSSTYIAKSLAATVGWTTTSTNECAIGNDFTTNNSTGFSATPPGRYSGGNAYFGQHMSLWTTTKSDVTIAYYYILKYTNADFAKTTSNIYFGRSVRCLKD